MPVSRTPSTEKPHTKADILRPTQLITLSGFPTSGKSTRAAQLHAYLAERIAASSAASPEAKKKSTPYRLHLISDQSLSIPRTVYDLSALPPHARSANAPEKDARASTYGAVKRVLTDRDIVILDGMNYIKGWRYQLNCEAKAVRTQSVVLQIGCTKDRSKAVNEARIRRRRGAQTPPAATLGEAASSTEETTEQSALGAEEDTTPPVQVTLADDDAEDPYDPGNWENLVFRYEEPNPMTRWDSPLFTLVWDDDDAQTRRTFDSIWEAIAGEGRSAVKPNKATVQRSREASGDYLYIMDRETQDIVKRILEAQQGDDGGGGATISIPRESSGATGGEQLVVELPGKKVGLPQLQRLRRAFMGLHRGGIGLEGVGDFSADRLRDTFVKYLNDSFENDD